MKSISLLLNVSMLAVACFTAIAFCGCSAFEQKAGPQIAAGLGVYCAQPLEARLLTRAEVAKLAAPNAVKACCAVDGPIDACK